MKNSETRYNFPKLHNYQVILLQDWWTQVGFATEFAEHEEIISKRFVLDYA